MQVKANLNHLRISPRKVRLVVDLIRGMDVKEAKAQLKFLTKRVAGPILKLLNSAVANAGQDFDVEENNLFISNIQVNEGPPLKRWRARAMGRAATILKRTSHINLILETKKEVKRKKIKASKPEVVKLDKGEEVKKPAPVEKVAAPQLQGEPRPEESGREEKPHSPRPYPTTSKSKKKFWSRQTFGNAKKFFRRKSF